MKIKKLGGMPQRPMPQRPMPNVRPTPITRTPAAPTPITRTPAAPTPITRTPAPAAPMPITRTPTGIGGSTTGGTPAGGMPNQIPRPAASTPRMAGMKKGGKVSSASSRADGCATKGKTKGMMIKMKSGGRTC